MKKKLCSGKSHFVKSNHDKLLKVDIGIDNRKVSFISRPKEYKTITGSTSYHQSPRFHRRIVTFPTANFPNQWI